MATQQAVLRLARPMGAAARRQLLARHALNQVRLSTARAMGKES